jgi:acyl-coenzyme A synthetase/AMP-(fatty) acid ligase
MKSLLHLFHRGVANLTGISQMYLPYLIHHFLENSAQRLPDKIAFDLNPFATARKPAGICRSRLKGNCVIACRNTQKFSSCTNIMQGYWKDPDATRKVLTQNGYNTGDLGCQDEDGFFFISGRKDNLLKVGGHRINPQEIEDVIMSSGLTIEAAVIGLPDAMLGTRLIALAVPVNGECTDIDILRLCAEKLPKYKIPAEVKLVRSLPKDSNGKINRSKCLELL